MEYQQDAYGEPEYENSEHASFLSALAGLPGLGKMGNLRDFLNPDLPDPSVGSEGWYLERKVGSIAEINKRIDIMRKRFPHRKHDILRHVDQDMELPRWPSKARFKLTIDLSTWGSKNEVAECYYDAQLMQWLVSPIVQSYGKYNPEEELLVSEVFKHLQYWVDEDISNRGNEKT